MLKQHINQIVFSIFRHFTIVKKYDIFIMDKEGIVIFYSDDLQIEIIDVFHINRTKEKYHTPKRPFHILTKRISGCSDMTFPKTNIEATPSDLLYIPANIEYSRRSYEDEEIIAIHFNILNKNFFEPFIINVDEEKCNEVFRRIYEIWTRREKGFKYRCSAVLYEYLSTVIIERNNSREYYKLEKSIRYIESNLSSKLGVDDLARMCGLCETQYRKLFRKEFGVSPIKYINKLRVNNAIAKMSSGYYSMAEIAELCGFSDQKYFVKIFKSETGRTPTLYKREFL